MILRGSKKGTNYDAESLKEAKKKLDNAGLSQRVMVDCSHGNSLKVHMNQLKVAKSLADQMARGDRDIMGVMIESNINEGMLHIPQCENLLAHNHTRRAENPQGGQTGAEIWRQRHGRLHWLGPYCECSCRACIRCES